MKEECYKIDDYVKPLTDKVIYVVGPLKLQNALMAPFIEKKTGIQCIAVESLNDISDDNHKTKKHLQLALLDLFGKDLKNFFDELASSIKDMPSDCVLGIINVRPGQNLEEKTVSVGIRGFFYEDDSLDQIIKGIHAIFAGELWISRKIMAEYILNETNINYSPNMAGNILTHRQKEILAMIATGATNDKVADRLHISTHTVKTHVYNIFKEINVTNRLQAALWAAKFL